MSDNIYDFLLRKRTVKLLLIRFLLYQRIFGFCFLLLTPNSVLYYTVTPNAASACKNCRKSQTRNTARAMCAPQNHPNYPSYHLQNQEGWSTETHFFEMEPGPTATSYRLLPSRSIHSLLTVPTAEISLAAHMCENGSKWAFLIVKIVKNGCAQVMVNLIAPFLICKSSDAKTLRR